MDLLVGLLIGALILVGIVEIIGGAARHDVYRMGFGFGMVVVPSLVSIMVMMALVVLR